MIPKHDEHVDTAAPTPTNTPVPAPTATPSHTDADVGRTAANHRRDRGTAQDFYDNRGPFTGTDVLRDVTAIRIERLGGSRLTACIAYGAAAVSAPDMVIGTNTRRFTFPAASDGSWQVVQMGGPGSCSWT